MEEIPVAYATVMEFDVDLDTHKRLIAAGGDEAIKGLIVHVAGPSEHGILSIDVWETKEDSERFFTERLVPLMESLELAGGPPLRFEELDAPVVLRG